jgi:hypothetical protein
MELPVILPVMKIGITGNFISIKMAISSNFIVVDCLFLSNDQLIPDDLQRIDTITRTITQRGD